jgi:acetolactate synthase small subunit
MEERMLGRRREPRREPTVLDRFHEHEREAHERNIAHSVEQRRQHGSVERVADALADDLREMVNAPGVVQRYAGKRAPLSCRIEKLVMEGSEELESRIAAAVADINTTVNETLDSLQRELDQLRDATNISAAAARVALENHIALASQTLQSAAVIRKQISDFRSQIVRSTPTVDDETLTEIADNKGKVIDDNAPAGNLETAKEAN